MHGGTAKNRSRQVLGVTTIDVKKKLKSGNLFNFYVFRLFPTALTITDKKG